MNSQILGVPETKLHDVAAAAGGIIIHWKNRKFV